MFDSQKLSCQAFLLGLKHGVYIFTNDTCQFCKDYKASIEHVNNANLYFVECILEEEKDIVYKLTSRMTMPITAAFVDGELQWSRVGQLFGEDLEEVLAYLNDTFGTAPLDEVEKQKKIAMVTHRCVPTFYIFPPNTTQEKRIEALKEAPKYNEFPIDVDSFNFIEDMNIRERMFSSNYGASNLVIFNIESTDTYSDFAKVVIDGYVAKRKKQFKTRSI